MNDLLCSDWSKIFRAKYWKWARLRVDPSHFPGQGQVLLGSRIISLVTEIWISGADDHLMDLFLRSVEAGVTVELKKLTIDDEGVYVGSIEPGLLSRAVLKLQDCTIHGVQLVQQEAIIAAISNSVTSLRRLKLFLSRPGSEVSQMAPDIVVGAAMKLEGLTVRLSSPQMEAVLAGISNSTITSLRYLDLGDDEIHHIAPDIVTEAAMKLESFGAPLSRHQVEAVLTRLADSQDSRLRNLKTSALTPWTHYLLPLDPEVVAGALTKLEKVGPDLGGILSAGQVSVLLTRILHSPDLRLTQLHLYSKDLSLVPPEVLVGAIQRLEVAWFQYGKMTREQLTAILSLAKENGLGRIKTIVIQRVDGMSSVSPSLLQQARQNIKLKWTMACEFEI